MKSVNENFQFIPSEGVPHYGFLGTIQYFHGEQGKDMFVQVFKKCMYSYNSAIPMNDEFFELLNRVRK